MKYKVLNRCPVCSSKLLVKKLQCTKCNTVIENDFELSKFDYLNKGQLEFVEVFLKSRGNIKDVEKALGISYPTVRAKLDEVLMTLGYKAEKQEPKEETSKNKDVLDALEKGDISPEEAIKLLNKE
ncbi:MAG: DUF2089 domain-containing protein [Clostridium sp.]|uniref:DUF2089 domain-containing protein n=1 Tax=Clostridium sp. TaxID=1506 RepID=UPI002A85F31D|nr:DUF2089 domain-containing protein [Clostridium sp.]MDY5097551.1 DUF2089 domain-containing protein [Clostridium sp.]